MATYSKYEPFIQKLVNGDLDLFGVEDTAAGEVKVVSPVRRVAALAQAERG